MLKLAWLHFSSDVSGEPPSHPKLGPLTHPTLGKTIEDHQVYGAAEKAYASSRMIVVYRTFQSRKYTHARRKPIDIPTTSANVLGGKDPSWLIG
jgi:hypothetical protein